MRAGGARGALRAPGPFGAPFRGETQVAPSVGGLKRHDTPVGGVRAGGARGALRAP